MTYAVGDEVQVAVPVGREKKAQWIPASISMVDPATDRVEVTFENQTRQRFALDTERIRPAEGRKEGEQWAF